MDVGTNHTVLLTNVDKASENYIQPTWGTRIETLNIYLKIAGGIGTCFRTRFSTAGYFG